MPVSLDVSGLVESLYIDRLFMDTLVAPVAVDKTRTGSLNSNLPPLEVKLNDIFCVPFP